MFSFVLKTMRLSHWSSFNSKLPINKSQLNNISKLLRANTFLFKLLRWLLYLGDNVKQNKGRNGTYHGLFRQFKSVKTVADCQYSCRLYRQLQTVQTVGDFQDSCSQSVSQSVCLSVSKSVRVS